MTTGVQELALGGAVCLALGALYSRRPTSGRDFNRWLHFLLPLLLFATVAAAWAAFRLVPHWNWSAARLAAAVRLVQGFPLYSGPNDAAVNGWIYGPVSAIAYAPAAFARDPLTALRLATVLNSAYFLLPIAVLLAGHLRRRCTWGSGFLILAFAVSVMLAPYTIWYGAAALNSDVVATGLGVLSCVTLARSRNLPLAAFLCAAAAWTKQIEALLAVAQLVYVFRARGPRIAIVYTGWLVLAALVTAVGFVVWFGAAPLWHCLIAIPSGHPLDQSRFGSVAAALTWATWWVWPLVAIVRPWRIKPGSETPDCASPAPLLLLASLAVLPAGVLAAAKTGGDLNSLHAPVYAVLGGTLLVVRMLESENNRWRTIARATLLGGTLLAAGFNLHRIVAYNHLAVRDPGIQNREAFDFVSSHPGECYFPSNPLVTLLAEGRDYPMDFGVHDWRIAGRPVDPEALRRLFPSTLTFIVYHEKDPSREVLSLFPDFNQLRQTASWDIFSRTPVNPVPLSTRD